MSKSAKEVARNAIFNGLAKSLDAMKKNNVDNGLIRECKAIHANTTFSDLPEYTKTAINQAVDALFVTLNSEGFTVVAKEHMPRS